MKILYITSQFYNKGSASIRNISLCNGLCKLGNKVDVLTLNWPDSNKDQTFQEFIDKEINIYIEKISIIEKYFKLKKMSDSKKNLKTKLFVMCKNIVKNIYYFPAIDKEWIKKDYSWLDNDYDLIISSSDTKTSHYVARKILKIKSCKWAQIWGDPWVDDAGTKGIRKIRAFISEKKLLRKADVIFYTSKPTTLVMKKKYSFASNKMFYLGRSYLYEAKKAVSNNDSFIFSYIGSVYYGRTFGNLFEAIKLFNSKSDKKIVFNIYGNNTEKNNYDKYSFVKFKGYVTFKTVTEIIESSDVLVLLSNMKKSHQIPGKLFDYFGSYSKILVIDNGNKMVFDFLESTDRCYIVDGKSINIDNIREILNMKVTTIPLKDYSDTEIARKFLKVVNDL